MMIKTCGTNFLSHQLQVSSVRDDKTAQLKCLTHTLRP